MFLCEIMCRANSFACSFMDPHGIVLLGVAFDSVIASPYS